MQLPVHLPHVPHDGVLLSVNEALQDHSDCHVNIIIVDIPTEVHPCMGLCYADDGFNVAHCDWNAACPLWKLTAERCEKKIPEQFPAIHPPCVLNNTAIFQQLTSFSLLPPSPLLPPLLTIDSFRRSA